MGVGMRENMAEHMVLQRFFFFFFLMHVADDEY